MGHHKKASDSNFMKWKNIYLNVIQESAKELAINNIMNSIGQILVKISSSLHGEW